MIPMYIPQRCHRTFGVLINAGPRKVGTPILERHHRRHQLCLHLLNKIALFDTDVKDEVICAVDRGLSIDALGVIMDSQEIAVERVHRLYP